MDAFTAWVNLREILVHTWKRTHKFFIWFNFFWWKFSLFATVFIDFYFSTNLNLFNFFNGLFILSMIFWTAYDHGPEFFWFC
jgi:hypothetical protein